MRAGKLAEAERYHRQALDGWRKALGNGHPTLSYALSGLGWVLLQQGRAEEALPVLQESFDIRSAKMDPGSTDLAFVRRDLGICLARLGRYDEAEALLLASYPVLVDRYGADNRSTRIARDGMAELGRLRGRPVALPALGPAGHP